MLGVEMQLVAMVTEMGPVERNQVALVVQTAVQFPIAALRRVLGVVVSAAAVCVIAGGRCIVLCVECDTI